MNIDYETAVGTPVSKNTNAKTRRILSYLRSVYGRKTLSGQYTNHGFSTETDAIFRETDKYPAVRGFDLLNYSPSLIGGRKGDTELAIEWDKMGGICTFSWHWYAPSKTPERNNEQFRTENSSFDLSKAVTSADIALKTPEELAEMSRNGEISEECFMLISDIDAISEQLKILRDNGVTVLWRPLHEASGGWFWWGAFGADAYKWLWKLLFVRQNEFHKLDDLIWIANAQSHEWYVGDEFCDINGEDIYPEKHDYSSQSERFSLAYAYSPKKMIAMTENGVIPDPDNMNSDGIRWLFFNTWCREFIVDRSGDISEEYTEKTMLRKAYSHPDIVTLEDLPKFD